MFYIISNSIHVQGDIHKQPTQHQELHQYHGPSLIGGVKSNLIFRISKKSFMENYNIYFILFKELA